MSKESISKETKWIPISSIPHEKGKSKERKEDRLYEPILNALKRVFEVYLDSEKQARKWPPDFEGKVYLEITAGGGGTLFRRIKGNVG